jgi:Ni/Co efflux regulator RcnB
MKTPVIASFLLAAAVAITGTTAFADDRDHHDHDSHDNHQYVHHDEWKKGAKMRDEDWGRGEHVDYKEHHLRRPPHGYEWREVDGNYVLAAAATGVIASIIAASVSGH